MKSKVFLIQFIWVVLATVARGEDVVSTSPVEAPPAPQCPNIDKLNTITYEDLRLKLERTLKEKNKSLIFLDFKGLQAQIDVFVNHLLSEDSLTTEQAEDIVKKSLAYLEHLDTLIKKAKDTAKFIKESHVVPLATLTSLKADADICMGSPTQFAAMFKILSQLNKDLNEILMISREGIKAQQDKVAALLDGLDDSKKESNISAKAIAENLNFIQLHINNVTRTFQFDSKVLQLASSQTGNGG